MMGFEGVSQGPQLSCQWVRTQVRTETPKGHLEAHRLESEAGLSGSFCLGKPPRPWLGAGRKGAVPGEAAGKDTLPRALNSWMDPGWGH